MRWRVKVSCARLRNGHERELDLGDTSSGFAARNFGRVWGQSITRGCARGRPFRRELRRADWAAWRRLFPMSRRECKDLQSWNELIDQVGLVQKCAGAEAGGQIFGLIVVPD